METGAITGYVDVAQVVLYVFWIFFFTLVFWLHRESKREGYPLEPDVGNGRPKQGFPALPIPKTFAMPDGSSLTVPEEKAEPVYRARRTSPFSGSPYEPEGDPMLSAMGPSSYANRAERPDALFDGTPRLQPLRLVSEYHVDSKDPNPVGMDLVGMDGQVGGRIVDVWVDRAESILRYFEFEKTGGGHALVPVNFTRIPGNRSAVKVSSIKGEHFAAVPGLANPDVVTFREEDMIMGYFGGGHMFADASRREPLL